MNSEHRMPPVYPVNEDTRPKRRRAVFSRGIFELEAYHAQSGSDMPRLSEHQRRGRDMSLQLLDDLTNRPLDALYTDARLYSQPSSRIAYWGTRIVVFLICIAVGFASCLFVRLLQSDPRKDVRQSLASELTTNETRLSDLERDVRKLSSQIDDEESLGTDSQTIATVRQNDITAGLVAVEGPGIAMTLSNPLAAANDTSGSIRVITDLDLQQLVSLLWQAGAEAVSINGNRIGVLTSIRTAGSQILVGTSPIESPYKLQAIGDKNALAQFMGEKNLASLYDAFHKSGIYPEITKSNSIRMDAATAGTLSYAKKDDD